MLQIKPRNIDEQAESDAIFQRFSIPVQYPVLFTEEAFATGNPVLAEAIRKDGQEKISLLCFVDSEVMKSHPSLSGAVSQYFQQFPDLNLLSAPIPVQGGEACKNDPQALLDIYGTLIEHSVDRHNCILVIGGGAVLDFIGYAAATAHRGIRLIRLPTTVLSQNDSGIGVKNGINFMHRKNYLGTFSPPDAVICDFSFLKTLCDRDKRAGMAEAVKVSLIRDAVFFDWMEENAANLAEFEMESVSYSIIRGAQIHAQQISKGGDPFEKGSNRPLDYGHWLAHKLEDMSGYQVRHGEAVAIGMLVDARYSYELGLFSEKALMRLKALLINLGFSLWHESLEIRDEQGDWVVLEGLEEFREHLGGDLSITLLKEIGIGEEVHVIDQALMKRSLLWVKEAGGKS